MFDRSTPPLINTLLQVHSVIAISCSANLSIINTLPYMGLISCGQHAINILLPQR
jgi:hypothetical protein